MISRVEAGETGTGGLGWSHFTFFKDVASTSNLQTETIKIIHSHRHLNLPGFSSGANVIKLSLSETYVFLH